MTDENEDPRIVQARAVQDAQDAERRAQRELASARWRASLRLAAMRRNLPVADLADRVVEIHDAQDDAR